ncbi:MAG: GTP-binding protein LepA [Patescibacteria group bacterium]|nr:GTP-binding protein LepA [Patescibacteria group bacterium]
MKTAVIRNFSIIAHIDHGKSTLADRIIELTGSVRKEKMEEQLLDSMDLEKERGITIKLKAIRMPYILDGVEYQLNLIDTPGHVDFGYEVSRSLAACEGALLLVDASQGVEAQTIANLEKAKQENIKIIPVINKIDLPSARVDETALQLIELGFEENDICYTSGKTGDGVDDLLKKIILKIPAPKVSDTEDTTALVFDSAYDDYRGVVAFVRVFSGIIKSDSYIRLMASRAKSRVVDLGYLNPTEKLVKELSSGEVGFVATGLKDIVDVRVGDTITLLNQEPEPIQGYKEPVPVVFLSIYPVDSSDYLDLRAAVEKLRLNDAAFSFDPENIGSMGKGFRCGFLGLLHADIICERITREFNIEIITTTPSVRYLLVNTKDEIVDIKSPVEFPDPTYIKEVQEPWALLDIYVTPTYMSVCMDLCKSRRAIFVDSKQVDSQRMKITYEIPLIELIIDFFDKLKSITSGYGSIDYKLTDYRATDVVKMDILVAGDEVAPLAQLVQRSIVADEGKRIIAKLKDLIPRQQFKVSLQASVGAKIYARDDISPVRKDVTGYLYGGDITRKMKLLEKQKKGKSRMRKFGKVEIPQDVFWKVMQK